MRKFNKKKKNRRLSERQEPSSVGAGARVLGRGLGLVVVFAALIIGLPLLAWLGYQQVLSSGYFAPQNVVIEGSQRVDEATIRQVVGLDEPGVNLIELDLVEAEKRLESLPWIKAAEITTSLPSELTIQIEEHALLGLVNDGQLFLVDEDGEVIKAWEGEALPKGPIVSGVSLHADPQLSRERVLQGFEIARLYREMGLERWGEISEVHFDALLGYALFTEKTEVRLGHDRFDERLERLWQVSVLLEERGTSAEYVLLDMEGELDQVAVKPWPKVVAAPPVEAPNLVQ